MRMQFSPDDGDEDAFFTRRDELGEQFAGWLNAHGVPGDPNDAGLLMDWKWSYGDGALDRWSVADVHEFLFGWCTRKLSATPVDAAEIPTSVAAFVDFLAHTGLLGPGDPPARIRRHCEDNTAAFVREMGNPANFGMAKSLFGVDGGVLDLDADFHDAEPPAIGPIRMPADAERLASAGASPMLTRMRALARYCASPGRVLTATGNLRLADARHLVELLDTGDDPTLGGVRTLQSATDLPGLSWAVETAIAAGVVRRYKSRLVAVARFAGLDDLSAFEALVPAGLDAHRRPSGLLGDAFAPLLDAMDDVVYVQLFQLLDRGPAGAGIDELVELGGRLVPLLSISGSGTRQLERLTDLGLIEIGAGDSTACPDCHVAHSVNGHAVLTPAGVGAVVTLAREAGIEVTIRTDPATATAADVVDLIGEIDEEEWSRDLGDWFAAQADAATASTALAAAVTAEHRETVTVLAGLQTLGMLAGELAVDAVTPHLGGPHDGPVLNWLIGREAVDPTTIDPVRLTRGSVDMLAAALDNMGPEEVAAVFSEGMQRQELDMLESIWRLDHPRLAEVLEAVGTHHPAKAIAKAARKALVKHRSMLADQRSRRG